MDERMGFQESINFTAKVLCQRQALLKALSDENVETFILSKVPKDFSTLDPQPRAEQEGIDLGNFQAAQKVRAAQIFAGLTAPQQEMVLDALDKAGIESKDDIRQILEDNLERPQDTDSEDEEDF
jgi:hypothetical protein